MKSVISQALNLAGDLVEANGKTVYLALEADGSVFTGPKPLDRRSFYEVHANGIRLHTWKTLENTHVVENFGGVSHQLPGDE